MLTIEGRPRLGSGDIDRERVRHRRRRLGRRQRLHDRLGSGRGVEEVERCDDGAIATGLGLGRLPQFGFGLGRRLRCRRLDRFDRVGFGDRDVGRWRHRPLDPRAGRQRVEVGHVIDERRRVDQLPRHRLGGTRTRIGTAGEGHEHTDEALGEGFGPPDADHEVVAVLQLDGLQRQRRVVDGVDSDDRSQLDPLGLLAVTVGAAHAQSIAREHEQRVDQLRRGAGAAAHPPLRHLVDEGRGLDVVGERGERLRCPLVPLRETLRDRVVQCDHRVTIAPSALFSSAVAVGVVGRRHAAAPERIGISLDVGE